MGKQKGISQKEKSGKFVVEKWGWFGGGEANVRKKAEELAEKNNREGKDGPPLKRMSKRRNKGKKVKKRDFKWF